MTFPSTRSTSYCYNLLPFGLQRQNHTVQHTLPAMGCMFVTPKFTCWNLMPSVTVFGDGTIKKWSDLAGEPSLVGFSALVKEALRKAPLPLWHVRLQWEDSQRCRSWNLPQPKCVSTLILDFPAPRTVKSKFLLFVIAAWSSFPLFLACLDEYWKHFPCRLLFVNYNNLIWRFVKFSSPFQSYIETFS